MGSFLLKIGSLIRSLQGWLYLIIVVLPALATLISGFYEGLSWAHTIALSMLAFMGGAVLAVCLIWIWSFFSTPAQLQAEADTKILELEKTIEDLKEEKRPKIDVSAIKVITPDYSRRMNRQISLEIKNTGGIDLTNCLVNLLELTDMDEDEEFLLPFPIAIRTQHQTGVRTSAFNLRVNQPKIVPIAILDEGKTGNSIYLYHETDDATHDIPRGKYNLKIEIYGGNTSTEKDFCLFVDDAGFLRMQETTSGTG